jgi:hypothetical protein
MAATYGEITSAGVKALGTRCKLGPSDIFTDLGSGCGRAVIQAVDQFGVASARGIELARSRHDEAEMARAALSDATASRITFVCGDCAAEEAWREGGVLAETTVAYVASLCFGDALMARLAERLAASRRVRTVATLKEFPGGLGGEFVALEPPEPCEMSWTAVRPDASGSTTQPVFLYARYTDMFDLRTLI